jgi:uncharacterized protein (UPF0332 family)
MKELRDFIVKAERFLKSAEQLFEMGDYDSCPPGAIMRCTLWPRRP